MIKSLFLIQHYLEGLEMAKHNELKKHKEAMDDFDFSEMMDESYDDEAIGMMSGIIEATNNQMKLAIELTKIVVEKNPAKEMKEEDVFSVFKRSLHVLEESFPLKALLEKVSACEA